MEIDLELQHPSHHRSLPLQDVKEPQLFREQFPYTSICRTEFDDVVLAPHPADQLCITDTTFRDGQQARPPYTVSQVAKIFDFLHRLGGKTGLITASEFFMYSERDRKCIDACRARGYRFPRITGWIRANKNDLQLARDMEFSEVGMLTSVSDYHIFLKLGKTRKQAFDMYVDLVSQALEWGIIPRCHFEDVTRAHEPETPVGHVFLATQALSADVTAGMDPDYQETHEKHNSANLGFGPCFEKYTGSGGKYSASEAHAEYYASVRGVFNRKAIPWQAGELGRVDHGGGGTVALFLAAYGMNVVDCGPALLAMHSPFELSSVVDIYACFEAYRAFYEA